MVVSGDVIEISAYDVPQTRVRSKQRSDTKNDKKLLQNRYRSKNNIKRLCLSNFSKNHSFITLTFHENELHYGRATHHLQNFLRTLRQKDKSRNRSSNIPFRYIAIPERQHRGAWHFHIICNRNYKHQYIASIWDHGYTRINKINSSSHIGVYISKYITKDLEVPKNKKSYFTSRNLVKPSIFYLDTAPAVMQIKPSFKKDNFSIYRKNYSYMIYSKILFINYINHGLQSGSDLSKTQSLNIQGKHLL